MWGVFLAEYTDKIGTPPNLSRQSFKANTQRDDFGKAFCAPTLDSLSTVYPPGISVVRDTFLFTAPIAGMKVRAPFVQGITSFGVLLSADAAEAAAIADGNSLFPGSPFVNFGYYLRTTVNSNFSPSQYSSSGAMLWQIP